MVDIYVNELHRYSDRTFSMSQSTLSIISAEIVVLTGGIVAFATYPVAFCIVPIAWTVWMFQSFITDHDTLKLGIYVEWLEERVNSLADSDVQLWEARLAERDNPSRAMIYIVTYVTYALVNTGSWIFSFWILNREIGLSAAIAFGILWVGTLAIAILNIRWRPRYAEAYRASLRKK